MTVATFQFWAPYRGRVNVPLELHPGQNPEKVARYAIEHARAQYARKWPFPPEDRKKMACVGASDGVRFVLTKDVPR